MLLAFVLLTQGGIDYYTVCVFFAFAMKEGYLYRAEARKIKVKVNVNVKVNKRKRGEDVARFLGCWA